MQQLAFPVDCLLCLLAVSGITNGYYTAHNAASLGKVNFLNRFLCSDLHKNEETEDICSLESSH